MRYFFIRHIPCQSQTVHQYTAYIKAHPAAAVFLACGLGKTSITLTAVNDLMFDSFEIHRALVVAPIRVASFSWPAEIEKWDHLAGLKYSVAVGTAAERLAALKKQADIYLINRENVQWLISESGIPFDFDMVVIDELSSFKNHQTKRFKALMKVRPKVKRIVGLTGTPSSNGLMDLWAEFRLLDMGERLGRFIGQYRTSYFRPDKQNGQVVFSYKPLPSAEKQMVQDALDGKIDLIVTKSVSRFARNTVDSLTTVRKLKEKGVEVYFQKENIYTLDSKGELLITIMSSLAQEESRSISENVTWGKRKRFADGKVSLAYSSFLGYRKGEDGQMEVVPEEAETVRLIYRLFMQGQTPYAIAKYLTDKNIPTPTGKETWRHRTVENILSNEKYKGDARLQKCYTVDFLSKKRKANEGEVPQYYVEGSHDAIIEPAEWQLVQTEIQRRKNAGRSHNCCGVFSAKLKCGDCGAYFGSKVWHSNSKYKRTVWQCNAKFKGESRCATPHLYEQRIKELFLEALGILMEDRETVIADCRAVMEALTDCSRIDGEAEEVSNEMEVVAGMIQRLVDENATRKLDQEDYRRKYAGYADRYAALESRMDGLKKERERREIQHDFFSGFLSGLEEVRELPVDFSGKLFHRMVDYATVHSDGRVVFTFRNGAEVSTKI